MSFSTPHCCICLENEDIYISCSSCIDGKYCENCTSKLVKEDKYKECSICRLKDWYKSDKETSNLMNEIVLKNKDNEVSLDDNSDNENDTVLEINTEDNNDIDNSRSVKTCFVFHFSVICSLLIICVLSFIGWWLLFGICMIEINVAEDYKILCKILISLSCGVALLLVPWILIKSIYKLYSKIKDNEHINRCNFIVVVIFVIATTVLGYISAFKLCELKEKFIEKNSVNNLILLIIAFLSGVAMWVILFLIIQIHELLYKYCNMICGNMICGNECTECCCNPIFILCFAVVSGLFTYLGWLFTFVLCGVKLNVNEEHNTILTIIVSYLVGNTIILGLGVCIGLISYIKYINLCTKNSTEEEEEEEEIL